MLDDLFKPAPDQVLKVAELTRQIKSQLETRFTRLWVKGEISNLRRQSSGHVYFSLKDTRSQLPCVLFARDAASQNFELGDGQEVLLYGDISVFEPHGRYQMIAKIALESGQGQLQVRFERLKRKLHAEGLFDAEKKRPLPTLPLRIAVITSPTGAAISDFTRILRRRGYLGTVVILPTRVQGTEAAGEIVRMIQLASASSGFDLLVVTRGGGSIEDLWPFNEEAVARAIGECPLPVISAIGHEIDTVLSDYVADKRAETPSGAAELISSIYLESLQNVETLADSLKQKASNTLKIWQNELQQLGFRFQMIGPDRQLQARGMMVDDLENRLKEAPGERMKDAINRLSVSAQILARHHPRNHLTAERKHLTDIQRRLKQTLRSEMSRHNQSLLHAKRRLKNSSLPATLERGYAIVERKDGSILDSMAAADLENEANLTFFDGKLPIVIKKPSKPTNNSSIS